MLSVAALALSATLVDPLIESALEKSGTPGAAIVVVHEGRIVHARGYGMADTESRTPATPDTVWPLASVTKILTALALMRLVDGGQVALDKDVNAYLKRAEVPATYPAPSPSPTFCGTPRASTSCRAGASRVRRPFRHSRRS